MAKLGINAVIYWRSAGSYGSPTWTAVDIISDLAVNPSWDEADASSRESRIKKSVKTVLGLEFSGRMKKKPDNAAYEAFMNAMLSDDALDVLVLDDDKDTVGARGWRCDVQVFSANEDQGMSTALYEDIVLKPTCSDNAAKAVLVGAGPALTYSTPGTAGGTFA